MPKWNRASYVTERPTRWRASIAAVALVVAVVASMLGAPGAAADVDPPGVMIAFDRDTGRELWRVETLPYFALTDVSSGSIVGRGGPCGGSGFENVGFAARSGHVRWRSPAVDDAGVRGGDRETSGSQRSGVVVVRSGEDRAVIEGRDAHSGALRWSSRAVPYADVQVNADSVAVSAEGIAVLDRRTGAERWSRTYPPDREITATLGDREIAITETEGNHRKNLGTEMLDVRDGSRSWAAELSPADIGRAATALAVSYTPAAAAPPGLEIRDTTTGSLLWARDRLPGLVAVSGGRVLTFSANADSAVPGAADVELHSFDVSTARTGRTLWGGATHSLPQLDRDLAVYYEKPDELVVADASDGSTKWRASLQQTGDVAIGRDAVYVTMGCFPLD